MKRTPKLAVGLLAAAATLVFAAPPAAADKVEWNISIWGASRAFTQGIETLASQLDERTGGNFTMRLHFGESVSPVRETLDNISIGAIEGGLGCVSYHPGKNPLATVLDLPFLPLADLDVLYKVQDAVANHEAVQKEMMRWDTVMFMPNPLPQYEMMGTGNAPKSLEDFRGMRVRALAGQGEAMRQLGAVPTTVPSTETYTMMERGVVQAALLPYSYAFGAFRLHEVSRWFTQGMQPGTIYCPTFISASALDRLSDEHRALLDELKPVAFEALKAAYTEDDDKWNPLFRERMEVVTFSDEELDQLRTSAGEPIWNDWVAEHEKRNLPAQEILDLVLEEARKASEDAS